MELYDVPFDAFNSHSNDEQMRGRGLGCKVGAAHTVIERVFSDLAYRAPQGQHARGASCSGLQWNAPSVSYACLSVQRPTNPIQAFRKPSALLTISASRPHVALARCAVEEPSRGLRVRQLDVGVVLPRGRAHLFPTRSRPQRAARCGLYVLRGAPQRMSMCHVPVAAYTRRRVQGRCRRPGRVRSPPDPRMAWWIAGWRALGPPGLRAVAQKSCRARCEVLDAGVRVWRRVRCGETRFVIHPRRAMARAGPVRSHPMPGRQVMSKTGLNRHPAPGRVPGRPSALRTGTRWRCVREAGVGCSPGVREIAWTSRESVRGYIEGRM
ncbi:hypothetical protein C8Q78DRAFT_315874 [Trametes maxima]|nr:hypothetical protein C8Q78DRAFT_315874 [Trametes maxima]